MSSCMRMLLLTTFFLFLSSSSTHASNNIKIKDGYTGISVSFQSGISSTVLSEVKKVISETSNLLFEATDGRAFFEEVTFLLPKTWNPASLALKTLNKTRIQSINDADFLFIKKGQALLDNPMTIQFEGCGRQGLQVQLPEKFITDLREDRSKILLNNWAKYRYGVFDEHGFMGDRLYPLFWSTPGVDEDNHKTNAFHANITSCAASSDSNAAKALEVREEDCQLQTNPHTGFPDDSSDCTVTPKENEDITSSMMSHPSLKNSRFFCNKNNHNSRSPNKHNNLCEGKSVSEVIFSHPDFKELRRTRHNSSVRAPEVKFNYLQEEETRVAFIIDTNDSTEKNIIQAALTRFQSTIKGTEYAHECIILDLKSSQEFHNGDPLTFDRPSDMKAVIWGKEVNEAINLHNIMIDLNRRLFDQRLKQDVTADVILITSGNITNTNTEALERIAETIKRLQLDFKVIIYPYRSASAIHSLRTLVNMVNGKLFLIPDSSSAVVSLMRLYDAFDYMLPTNDMLIHRQEFNSGDNNINFGFEIDKSVTGSTKLVAQLHHSSAGEDIFGPSLTLLKPDNRKFTSKSSGVELAHGFVVPLHKHSSDTGKWELHFERKSNKSLMIGSAYVRSPSKSDVITAKCILSEATDSLPPAVHVFVSTNGPLKLIQDAQVDVTLTSDDQIVKTFPLYDDGLANPDVTQGDGIYSRYLYEANRLGFYGVEVRVKSKVDQTKYYEGCRDVAKMTCCGSSVPNITLFGSNEKPEKIFHLQRIVNCGFLYVKRDFNPEDHVDRISDLKVEGVSKSERQVSVSFTAPSRSTSMTASIFTDSQYDRIREHFDEGTPVSPGYDFSQTMPRRDRETRNNYKLSSHHWSEGIYHLAIRVGEPNGHHKISNIITFFMPTDPSKLTTEGDLSPIHTRQPSRSIFAGLDNWHFIGFALLILVFLVIFVTCCICFCSSMKRKDLSKTNAARSSNNQVPSETEKKKNKKNTSYTNGLHSNLTIQTTMGSHDQIEPEKVTPSSGHSSALKYGPTGGSDIHLNHHYHGYVNDAPTMMTHDSAYNQVPVSTSINPFGHVTADFLLDHYGKVKKARTLGLPPPVVNAEEVIKNQDGSCFTGSDNDRPSRDSDSYDDNVPAVNSNDHHFQATNPYNHGNLDWSYENVGYHAQPAYVHYNQQYQDNSSFYTQLQAPLPTHGIHDPSALPSTTHHVIWQEGHSYLPRSQSPTSDNSSNHYDPRYGQRRSTTVSQV